MDRLTRPGIDAEQTAVRFMDMEVKMQDVGDKLLDLILNGPTINGVSKNILRHLVRQLYDALKAYEDTGLTPEQVAAMKQELAKSKADLQWAIKCLREIGSCAGCKHEDYQETAEPCSHCQRITLQGEDKWEFDCEED